MTPEGAVKEAVKKCLAEHGIFPASKAGAFPETANGWYFMPVSNGMGVTGIPDIIGVYQGAFFAIETKARGRKPTAFQALQIQAIRQGTGSVFVIDGDLADLENWFEQF